MGLTVNWQNFDKLIMIKKLRKLVGEWWDIQMHFTDEKGYLRGVPSGQFFSPLNPISKAIVGDPTGFKLTMQDVKKTTIDASLTKKPKVVRNHSGFSALFVPLRVGGKNLGCVFADGFLSEHTKEEQQHQIKSFLFKVFGPDGEDLFPQIDDLPVLADKDLHYLCELIKLVVSEMLDTRAHLSRMKENLSSERKKVAKLKEELGDRFHFSKMIGKSQNMQKLYHMVEKICDSRATVLVRGENGTGKELISRALHYNSSRKKEPFLVVNCGAFNDNLLESELFGHVKGAFTGANRDKKGVFAVADGGTLFLDEIGDTSLSMQVKLLRVLQEGTFIPVGSTASHKTQVRIVAATNRNLEQMMAEKLFREDLYYRLNVITLDIPPLRERKEDIPLLINYFLNKHGSHLLADDDNKVPLNTKVLSHECLTKLLNYDWPGNVRELENEIERLCVIASLDDFPVPLEYLSARLLDSDQDTRVSASFTESTMLKESVEHLERAMIESALEDYGWDQVEVAKRLGIPKTTLLDKIRKYQLDKREMKKAS
ncbi:MAG: sigma 54-interacting transcriptional regulator [Proteobacteria bacterium]|nr:sigma 54-interacting transcriptional regulator [Pseudomonadota bacterium]